MYIIALVENIFYFKGGCLIRMMNYALSSTTFSTGIRVRFGF